MENKKNKQKRALTNLNQSVVLKRINGALFNETIASSQLNFLNINLVS